MNRRLFPSAVLLFGLALSSSAWPQQQPAIPVTVKSLVKSPPKVGQLLQVSGYLLTNDKEPKLQDTDNERKVILDFSQSQVTPERLGATASISPPVMIIGRMQGTKDNGKPIITVIGATNLTP